MADCSNSGTKKTCWICSDEEYCKFPVCYESEVTEQIKREEEAQGDLFGGEE
jgi:hypothetical protein